MVIMLTSLPLGLYTRNQLPRGTARQGTRDPTDRPIFFTSLSLIYPTLTIKQTESPRVLLRSWTDYLYPHHGQILDPQPRQNRLTDAQDSNFAYSRVIANDNRDGRKKTSTRKH